MSRRSGHHDAVGYASRGVSLLTHGLELPSPPLGWMSMGKEGPFDTSGLFLRSMGHTVPQNFIMYVHTVPQDISALRVSLPPE